jgi:hypothetical protein
MACKTCKRALRPEHADQKGNCADCSGIDFERAGVSDEELAGHRSRAYGGSKKKSKKKASKASR